MERQEDRGSCGYGLWCRVFAAERSTNNGGKNMGGGRPMTAGDRQSETCAHEYVERREEEDVSGISRAPPE